MITVPIFLNYDSSKVVGSVTIDESAIADKDDVLALGYRIVPTPNGERMHVRMFGLIAVKNHAAFPERIKE